MRFFLTFAARLKGKKPAFVAFNITFDSLLLAILLAIAQQSVSNPAGSADHQFQVWRFGRHKFRNMGRRLL